MDLASSFGAVASSLTDGFVTINAQGAIVATNPAIEKMFGYTKQELLSQNIAILMPKEEGAKHQAHLDASTVGTAGRALRPDRTLKGRRKDGTIFPITITVFSLNGSGDEKFFLGLITDQSAGEALKEERHKTELLYRNIDLLEGVGLWRLNVLTKDLEWTDQVFEIHGLKRGDFEPTIESAINQYHHEDREAVTTSIEAAINRGESFEFRGRLARPDGTIGHVRSNGQCELGPDGKTISVFGTFVDITKEQELIGQFERQAHSLKELSSELETAKEKAETASETKSMFLANMSHEARTPLNGVLGMLSLLEFSNLDEQQSECVDMAKQATYDALALINDLLDYSQLEAAKLSINPEEFSLADLLARLNAMLAPKAKKKSLTLTIDSDLGDCRITGDALRIQQILINLGDNAIKFTEAGDVQIHLARCESTDDLIISVKDTGEGMTPDHINRIFDRFEQIDPSSTRRHEGVGLGLSICRTLVDLMDGDISVQSELGLGTEFVVRLPLPMSEMEDDAQKASAKGTLDTQAGLRILAAEDNTMNQEILKRLAAAMHFDLTIASNGAEAVDMFHPDQFDIVLMDIHMPIMDGLQASETIRATGAETPIVAVTADVTDDMDDRLSKAGINGCVTKPYELGSLISEIDRVLQDLNRNGLNDQVLTQQPPGEQFGLAAGAT